MNCLPLLLAAAVVGDPGTITAVADYPNDFNSVSDVLQIVRRAGAIDFSVPQARVLFEAEFFQQGKQLPAKLAVDCSYGEQHKQRRLHFAIHVVDLDYLRLGQGKTTDNRWCLKVVDATGYVISTTRDIAKSKGGLNGVTTYGFLPRSEKQSGRRAVYFMARVPPESQSTFHSPKSVEDLLGEAKDGDAVVLYVTCK